MNESFRRLPFPHAFQQYHHFDNLLQGLRRSVFKITEYDFIVEDVNRPRPSKQGSLHCRSFPLTHLAPIPSAAVAQESSDGGLRPKPRAWNMFMHLMRPASVAWVVENLDSRSKRQAPASMGATTTTSAHTSRTAEAPLGAPEAVASPLGDPRPTAGAPAAATVVELDHRGGAELESEAPDSEAVASSLMLSDKTAKTNQSESSSSSPPTNSRR
jgi:hypothetical protein